ncbi:MAG: hypothetical protein U9N78_10860 [Actinomycetota bacterium]|nr:hypothetical protein [Actinomycetota bacterium]
MNDWNRTFRIALLAVALLIATTACAAFPQQGADPTGEIAGTYYVNGIDSREIEYGGRLEITAAADEPDRFELQWIITGSVQLGTGVLDGDVLEAKWSTVEGLVNREDMDASHGTVTYTIETDGTLNGIRTTAGLTETGTEEAFPVRP